MWKYAKNIGKKLEQAQTTRETEYINSFQFFLENITILRHYSTATKACEIYKLECFTIINYFQRENIEEINLK